MSKVNLPPIQGGFASVTGINDRLDAIEDAFDNTLSRDGSVPNSMDADLDMDGNDILNIGSLSLAGGITLQQIVDAAEAEADRAEAEADRSEQEADNAEAQVTLAEGQVTLAEGFAGDADAARIAAETAQGEAEGARDTAFTYRNEAEGFKDLAEQWATEDRDVEVEPGKYSAFHWSEVAQEYVLEGVGIDDDVTAIDSTWSSTKIDNDLLRKDQNLSDVNNATLARQNIGAHNASNLTTGTLNANRLPEGVEASSLVTSSGTILADYELVLQRTGRSVTAHVVKFELNSATTGTSISGVVPSGWRPMTNVRLIVPGFGYNCLVTITNGGTFTVDFRNAGMDSTSSQTVVPSFSTSWLIPD